MSTPLEKLREQRALILQHLNWLDAQIESAESSPTQESLPEAAVEASQTKPKESITHDQKPKIESAATASVKKPKEDSFLTEDDDTPIPKAPAMGRDVVKARIGCLALFIGATLIFLFLLFGLPYLLN